MKTVIKKINSFYSKGSSLIIVLLVALVVAGGLVLTNGLFTDTNKPPTDSTVYTPVTKNFDDNKLALQLKTINFESCKDSAVIGFLVDQSGSMAYGTKEINLKDALNKFTISYPPEGVLGLKTYSDPWHASINASWDVPFDFFKNNSSKFRNSVNRMSPEGGTYTKDAFEVEKQLLANAKAQSKFSKYKFNLIFISDGVPETKEANDVCNASRPNIDPRYCGIRSDGTCRCFDPNQDPTTVATEIKKSGVRIFSIGYINQEDDKFKTDLTDLMKRVASSEADFYFAPADSDITGILKNITEKICSAQP